MSQNPLTDSFTVPPSQNPSHINNTSLNILNKISAISIKNLSKNSSFDLNEFSFLQDFKPNPPQIIQDSPLKPLFAKGNIVENTDNLAFLPKNEKNGDKNQNLLNKIRPKTQRNEGLENIDLPFSNKKNPTFNLAEKSTISNQSENFDFLVKDWNDYFYDDEPSKIKVFSLKKSFIDSFIHLFLHYFLHYFLLYFSLFFH